MQAVTRSTRLVAILALCVGSSLGASGVAGARTASSGRAATTPAVLAVTPNTNLVDDQAVSVTAPAGVEEYSECPATYTGIDNCSIIAEHTSATDTIHVVAVVPGESTSSPVAIDCRTTSCVLVAISYDISSDGSTTVLAQVALGFDPSGALRPAPTVTGTPSTDLVDQQPIAVTVHPSGTDSPDGPIVFPCTTPTPALADFLTTCDLGRFAVLTPGAGDTATGSIPAPAYVETSTGPVDCRATGATCAVVTIDTVAQFGAQPLTFTPDGPVQPALLSRYNYSSAPGPDPNQTFDLVGFTPSDPFTVKWCNDGGTCLAGTVASGTLTAAGIGTFVYSDADLPDDPGNVCTLGCTLTATDAHGLSAQGGPSFIVGTPIPTGPVHTKFLHVRANPHKGLHDGDTVTVTGSGFRPGADLTAVECNGNASVKGPDSCDFDTSTFLSGKRIVADAHGNVSTTFTIRRRIKTVAGADLDCAKGNIDPDAFDAGVATDPSRAVLKGTGYFSCAVILADISDYAQSGGDPVAFAGAHFKPLPWAVTPAAYHPPTAPAAAVPAQPTFTG